MSAPKRRGDRFDLSSLHMYDPLYITSDIREASKMYAMNPLATAVHASKRHGDPLMYRQSFDART